MQPYKFWTDRQQTTSELQHILVFLFHLSCLCYTVSVSRLRLSLKPIYYHVTTEIHNNMFVCYARSLSYTILMVYYSQYNIITFLYSIPDDELINFHALLCNIFYLVHYFTKKKRTLFNSKINVLGIFLGFEFILRG